VSHSSDDTPTGPIGGQTQRIPGAAAHRVRAGAAAAPGPTPGWTTVRDLTAAALLVVAPLLPWNLYFGLGIPGTSGTAFAVLLAVTLLSLLALGVTRLGPVASHPAVAGRLRAGFNAPYLLLVLAFVGFDVFETVRFAGTVQVPGGVGPGAWLGVAGALLSAQPASTDPADRRFPLVRVLGYASMLGAALSFGFNLYWRVKYALGGSEFGRQNVAVITSAVVYGVVALVAVLVASTWLVRTTKASRLATVALGASELVAGILVWILPVGRDVDAFHGIAQNTSTAGVGFEGYLAWAAAAALFAPRTLADHRATRATEANAWRAAARNGLLLIAVWCLGSIAMRLTDLTVAVSLNYPFSRYDSIVLAGFDLVTAALALWLRVNLANDAVSARLVSSLCGLVATLSVSRVVLGVALAPRFQETPNAAAQNPVYGNDLAQQITSVFDVTLCGLALCILTAAIVTGRRRRRGPNRTAPAGARRPSAAPTTRVRVPRPAPPSAAATTRIPTGAQGAGAEHPTTVIPQAGPRLFRGDDSTTGQIPVPKPRIFRAPHDTK
jgi:hypothetical protein